MFLSYVMRAGVCAASRVMKRAFGTMINPSARGNPIARRALTLAAAAAIIGMHVPEGARRTALVDAKVVDEAGAPTMEACEDLVDWAAGRAFEVHAASASALAELEELFGEEDRMDRMFGEEEEESEDENN